MREIGGKRFEVAGKGWQLLRFAGNRWRKRELAAGAKHFPYSFRSESIRCRSYYCLHYGMPPDKTGDYKAIFGNRHAVYFNPYSVYFNSHGFYFNPHRDYKKPHGDYKNPHGDYKKPRGDYKKPRGDYKKPHGDCKKPHGDCKKTHGDYEKPRGDRNNYYENRLNRYGICFDPPKRTARYSVLLLQESGIEANVLAISYRNEIQSRRKIGDINSLLFLWQRSLLI